MSYVPMVMGGMRIPPPPTVQPPIMAKPHCNLLFIQYSLLAISAAAQLLKPQRIIKTEEMRKLYVGKLPRGISDEFIERILKVNIYYIYIYIY